MGKLLCLSTGLLHLSWCNDPVLVDPRSLVCNSKPLAHWLTSKPFIFPHTILHALSRYLDNNSVYWVLPRGAAAGSEHMPWPHTRHRSGRHSGSRRCTWSTEPSPCARPAELARSLLQTRAAKTKQASAEKMLLVKESPQAWKGKEESKLLWQHEVTFSLNEFLQIRMSKSDLDLTCNFVFHYKTMVKCGISYLKIHLA